MTPADVPLLLQGYRRGWVPWATVAEALKRAYLPRCSCGRPADGGGWQPGERHCSTCTILRLEAVQVPGRVTAPGGDGAA